MVLLTQQFEFSRRASSALPAALGRREPPDVRQVQQPARPRAQLPGRGDRRGRAGCPQTGPCCRCRSFEQIVKERVVDRLDHKHLNEDMAEFRELNPSVENIARVIWGMLAEQVAPAACRASASGRRPRPVPSTAGPDGLVAHHVGPGSSGHVRNTHRRNRVTASRGTTCAVPTRVVPGGDPDQHERANHRYPAHPVGPRPEGRTPVVEQAHRTPTRQAYAPGRLAPNRELGAPLSQVQRSAPRCDCSASLNMYSDPTAKISAKTVKQGPGPASTTVSCDTCHLRRRQPLCWVFPGTRRSSTARPQ